MLCYAMLHWQWPDTCSYPCLLLVDPILFYSFHCTVLCCAVLCCAVLYCTVSYRTVPMKISTYDSMNGIEETLWVTGTTWLVLYTVLYGSCTILYYTVETCSVQSHLALFQWLSLKSHWNNGYTKAYRCITEISHSFPKQSNEYTASSSLKIAMSTALQQSQRLEKFQKTFHSHFCSVCTQSQCMLGVFV
jgi:hypothetical protein